MRISAVALGTTLNYSTDETYEIPLALADKPGGGARLAWMTGYAHYGGSTTSMAHVSELDCDEARVVVGADEDCAAEVLRLGATVVLEVAFGGVEVGGRITHLARDQIELFGAHMADGDVGPVCRVLARPSIRPAHRARTRFPPDWGRVVC